MGVNNGDLCLHEAVVKIPDCESQQDGVGGLLGTQAAVRSHVLLFLTIDENDCQCVGVVVVAAQGKRRWQCAEVVLVTSTAS